ncbi:MAG: DUF1045 domain-containing protein [Candidatus Riflebacteria bacterium]|nr:DUF1045 domain-containing protein [Candidatus Riflebacteria bacterium]
MDRKILIPCAVLIFIFVFVLKGSLFADGNLKVNVFAIVSEPIQNQVKEAGKELQSQESLQSFTERGYQIHCTLYMTNYDSSKLKDIASQVENYAKGVKSFDVNSLGISKTANDWLFINIAKNKELQSLSDELVTNLSPLRAQNQSIPAWAKNDPEKLEYIKKYGSPNVFNQFSPHLTLLAKTDGSKLNEFLEKNKNNQALTGKVSGKIEGIGYGFADGDGQIKKPEAVFYFPKN